MPKTSSRICIILVVAFTASTICAKGKVREIQLGEVYSTSGQDGLRRLTSSQLVDGKRIKVEHTDDFGEIQRRHKSGTSNLFLVEAVTLADAINATRSALIGYGSTDRPLRARKSNPSRGSYWLVVYLGAGHSSPLKWQIENIVLDDTRIQLTYTKPKAGYQTTDIRSYYYWIPLGKLEGGAYRVGTYDSGIGDVTLSRRVEVPVE